MRTSKNKNKEVPFRHITIIGVGLIGGSLGLAIKQRYPSIRITGVDRKEILKKALASGAIDHSTNSITKGVNGSELVILAQPIGVIQKSLPIMAQHISPTAIVTDVGSIKKSIVQEAEKYFPKGNFIGGHPMTGAETSGIQSAQSLLFENAVYVLTPVSNTLSKNVLRLAHFLENLGARILILDVDTHDKIAASISHVPQLVSVALINLLKRSKFSLYRTLAAGGFRDITRIASSPFELWRDILSINKKEIQKELRSLINELYKYDRSLNTQNLNYLRNSFKSAKRIRQSIPKNMKGFLSQHPDLYLYLKDRPGELARLTTAIAKAGINIKDIELVKIREGIDGTFRLSFESLEQLEKAKAVLKDFL